MGNSREDERNRGRRASSPRHIPLLGWRDIALRVKREIQRDNLSIVAAGVAFYGFLALVPLLAAIVSLYGLISDPDQVKTQLETLSGVLPESATQVLRAELERLTSAPSPSLGVGFLTAIAISLWSASRGSRALIQALNIVYEETARRGFVRHQLVALYTTLLSVLVAIIALGLLVVVPLVLSWIGLGAWQSVVGLLRWPVLLLVSFLGLGALYRYAPLRTRAKTRWVSWGAAVATLMWLAASWGFSLYVERVASFSASFGSIGTVAILLLWLYITAFVILLGGEINAEMEHQTAEDTTVGPPRPMGERGAYVADHIGPVP